MNTVLVEVTLPRWAQCFDTVKNAMNREAGRESPGAVTVTFEDDQDDWLDAHLELRSFLSMVRIGHDERLSNEVGAELVHKHDARRYDACKQAGVLELVESHESWAQGDDDVLNVKDLSSLLTDCGADALAERIRFVAQRCGQTMIEVGKIPKPSDDLLFAMAVVARDADLVRSLANPERVNAPLMGFGFQVSGLHRALNDNDVDMMGVLLTHGARTDARISPNRRTTLADIAEDPEQEIEERARDLMRSARAREAAAAALSSLHVVAMP